MTNVATAGYYWSSSFYSSPTDYRSCNLDFVYDGRVIPDCNLYRSYGLSLRCVQE